VESQSVLRYKTAKLVSEVNLPTSGLSQFTSNLGVHIDTKGD